MPHHCRTQVTHFQDFPLQIPSSTLLCPDLVHVLDYMLGERIRVRFCLPPHCGQVAWRCHRSLWWVLVLLVLVLDWPADFLRRIRMLGWSPGRFNMCRRRNTSIEHTSRGRLTEYQPMCLHRLLFDWFCLLSCRHLCLRGPMSQHALTHPDKLFRGACLLMGHVHASSMYQGHTCRRFLFRQWSSVLSFCCTNATCHCCDRNGFFSCSQVLELFCECSHGVPRRCVHNVASALDARFPVQAPTATLSARAQAFNRRMPA